MKKKNEEMLEQMEKDQREEKRHRYNGRDSAVIVSDSSSSEDSDGMGDNSEMPSPSKSKFSPSRKGNSMLDNVSLEESKDGDSSRIVSPESAQHRGSIRIAGGIP